MTPKMLADTAVKTKQNKNKKQKNPSLSVSSELKSLLKIFFLCWDHSAHRDYDKHCVAICKTLCCEAIMSERDVASSFQ